MDALKKGLIEYLPLHYFLKNLVRFRILPLSAGTEAIKVHGDFDLVHCHGYSVKIVGKRLPVILSDSSSNYLFLRDYVGWPEARIGLGYWIRRQLFARLGIIDCDTNWQSAKKIIVFSDFAAKVHRGLGVPSKEMIVVPPGLPKTTFDKIKKNGEINILFIGIWFERKGGPLLLSAFEILAKKYPKLTLTIVGPVSKRFQIKHPRIKQTNFVPRTKLLSDFFPKADIFVLVPPVAEGYGFVLLEAASFGIPAIVSRVYALPEIMEDGKTGYVIKPADLSGLVKKLESLIINERLRKRMGINAKKVFLRKYSLGIFYKRLLRVYKEALKLN